MLILGVPVEMSRGRFQDVRPRQPGPRECPSGRCRRAMRFSAARPRGWIVRCRAADARRHRSNATFTSARKARKPPNSTEAVERPWRRRPCECVRRQAPIKGIPALPLRLYSQSYRSGWPGAGGTGPADQLGRAFVEAITGRFGSSSSAVRPCREGLSPRRTK
jgi:hypothetical protein